MMVVPVRPDAMCRCPDCDRRVAKSVGDGRCPCPAGKKVMRVHQDIEPQEQIEGPSDNMNGRLPARDDGLRHVDLHGVAIGQINDDDIYRSC